MKKKIVSIHFPKSAGTSLRIELTRHFGETLELDYDCNPLGRNSDIIRDALGAGKIAVHGHFPAKRYASLPNAFRFTFLRDPLDNLISIYCYWKRLPEHGIPLHSKFLAETPRIDEFARHTGICDLMSKQYFGDFDVNLLDFVGFFHRFADDKIKLSSLIGVPLSGDVFENKIDYLDREREEILLNGRLIGDIKTFLRQDLKFYEKMLLRFP